MSRRYALAERDRNFIKAVGVPVAQVAFAMGKSRQAVNRGVNLDDNYFKASDFARALESWKREPALRGLARDAITALYPEMSDAVLRAAEAMSTSDFAEDVPGEYWFLCGDLPGFRTHLTVCAQQLDTLCANDDAQVKLFVSGKDIEAAQRIEARYPDNFTRAIRCNLDLTVVPSTLVRTDVDDNIDLFAVTETGFTPLSRGEASRLRMAIYEKLLEPATKSQAARTAALQGGGAASGDAAAPRASETAEKEAA
jgi:hypothetical protein